MFESEQVETLAEDERVKALQRLELLQPFLEYGVPLNQVALQSGVPLRTLQRWLARYYQEGLVGLTRKRRADRGKRRYIPQEIQRVIEEFAFVTPSPTAAFVHRYVTQFAKEYGLRAPSYRSVATIMRTYSTKAMKSIREAQCLDQRALNIQPLFANRPNQIWQVIHTQVGIFTISDRGQQVYPWVTFIVDRYSKAIAGYFVSYQNSPALTTALALRQAIWHKKTPQWTVCGIPEQLYLDYGGAYSTRDLEQVSADLNMQLIFSEPRILDNELGLNSLNDRILRHVVRGFYEPQDRRYSQPSPVEVLTLLDEHIHAALTQVYHVQPQPEIGMSPQQCWLAPGFSPRLPQSLDQLDRLLAPVPKPRRVHRNGIYFGGILYGHVKLSDYVGELVKIRYDPCDASHIWVYLKDKLICHASLNKILKRSTRITMRQSRQEELSVLRHVF